MQGMNDVLGVLSKSISESMAKAIVSIKRLGMDKDQALKLVTRMVEYAYSGDDVRKKMISESNEVIKKIRE